MATTEILISVIIVLLCIYYWFVMNYNFWKSRGIPGPKPIPIFGTVKDMLIGKYAIGSYLNVVYHQFPNEPMIGLYVGREPVLMLNDMDLIKNVLIKDFKCFMDRGMHKHENEEPLAGHLFNLEAKRWRPLRTKLTPVFSSGKLKEMFYLLIQCAEQLEKCFDRVANDGKSVDVREICAKFSTDVIGVCAFGLQANALSDEESTFRQMGKRIFCVNFKRILQFYIMTLAPAIYDIVGKWFVDKELIEFFSNIAKDTVEYRRKNNIVRHDFIDLLSALRDEPSIVGDIELTDSIMAAQLFVFFIAGFETSSSTMSNCLFELAMDHSIRDKLQTEIRVELMKTNGAITYDGIKSMKYLDKVVNETLRKYPPLTLVMRKTTTSYTFPGTSVTIPTGTRVWIPNFAIQRDPKYFPDPQLFDPERFTEEAIKSRPSMAFLSFGEGPRNCIGARFGQMQTKVGLVKIFQNYTVDVCEKTDKNYTINPHSFLLTPKNGVFVKVIKNSINK